MDAPFHNYPFMTLNKFQTLETLVMQILKSLEVTEVKVRMPLSVTKEMKNDPAVILPMPGIESIIVGNASYSYIFLNAGDVLKIVSERIKQINEDSGLNYTDKFKRFNIAKANIISKYRYFDRMSPIRYMSRYKWHIIITEDQEGKMVESEYEYPNSKLDLQEGHWNFLDNSFAIRRDLLNEILFLIDTELEKLADELANTKYAWADGDWQYELTEICLALLRSGRLKIVEGSEETFKHDFFSLFGRSAERFSYFRDKIITRAKPAKFIAELVAVLEKQGRNEKHK